MRKLLALSALTVFISSCNRPDKNICLDESIPFSETISIPDKEIQGFFNLKTGDTTSYLIINSQAELAERLKFGNTMPTHVDFENNAIYAGCIYNRNKATVTSQRVDRVCKGGTVIYSVTLKRSLAAEGLTSYFVVVPKQMPGTMIMFNRVYEN